MAGAPADDKELDQMFGEEVASQIKQRRKKEPDDFLVLPENWPAVQLLQSVGSCWQYAPMSGHVLGLNYQAVDVVIRRGGFEPFESENWHRFQVLESVAKSELNRLSKS